MFDESQYDRSVKSQMAQFPDANDMHALPPIFSYWVKNHLLKKLRERLHSSHTNFFPLAISDAINQTGIPSVLSIGSGDSTQEILIMKELRRLGHSDVKFLCTDLTPTLIANARVNIESAGFSKYMHAEQVDLNLSFPKDKFACVVAIDSLHHMLNLEKIFEDVENTIGSEGSFIFRDVIGRNGHMRWPETLGLVRDIWAHLPRRYKYNHMTLKIDQWFENFDCSIEGFEGIRSQDIMALLVKNFDFKKICTYGGLVDPFIDRTFGFNWDPNDASDLSFINSLQEAEDNLFELGLIKPTQIYGIARKRGVVDLKESRKYTMNSIRDPELLIEPIKLDKTSIVIPYANVELNKEPTFLNIGQEINFGINSIASDIKRWGWNEAEFRHTWSYRQESLLVFRIEKTAKFLSIETIGYVVESLGPQIILCFMNDLLMGEIIHSRTGELVKNSFELEGKYFVNEAVANLRFESSYSRNPDRDGGLDRRAIGFALVVVSIL